MDLRLILGYQKGSPWEFASENLIHTKNGLITMKNTNKPLLAYDANNGKFLSKMKPGNTYKFNTDKILEKPFYQAGGFKKNKTILPTQYGVYSGLVDENGKTILNPTYDQSLLNMINYMKNNNSPLTDKPSNVYRPEWEHHSIVLPKQDDLNFAQNGGLINDCPDGYIKDETGQCVENNNYNPQQYLNKGMPIVPIKNINNEVVGGTNADVKTFPNFRPKKRDPNFSTTEAIGAITFGLSAFANKMEEGRQKAWNQKQMANNLFNGTYSNAQNDYGINPYEQTGQLRQFQKGGGLNILKYLYDDDSEEENIKTTKEENNIKKNTKRITEENIDNNELNLEELLTFSKRNKSKNNVDYNSISKVSSSKALNDVKNYYSSKGYPKEFVAGVLGNIYTESNGISNINEISSTSGKGGFGLFQHTGKRRTQLFNFALKNNLDPSNPITQARFAEQEPDFKIALNKSKGKSAEESAKIFEETFERPGIKRSNKRIGAANNFYNSFQKGGSYVVDFATMRDLEKNGIKFKLI